MEIMNIKVLYIGVILILLLLFIPFRKRKYKKGIKIANTKYVKAMSFYKKLLIKYRINLFLIILTFIVVLGSSFFLVARLIKVDEEVNEKYNRDIFLCMDVSPSVNDLNQEIVKTFKETVKKLEEDRVGIVIFNTSAIVLSPLTDDYDYILDVLDKIEEAIIAYKNHDNLKADYILKGTTIGYDEYGMSLIGDGLASCVNTFANTDRNNKELMSEDRTRIIIFSTDNQLSGYPIFTLKEAAEFAKSKKIKVYGIATSSIRPINKQEFQEAMQITNGKLYENAKDTVSSIIQEITSTNKSILKTEKETIQTDIPQQAFLILIMGFSIYVIFSRMVRK